MGSATTKTISLLLLIVIGYLFQRKIRNASNLEGIKTLILGLALPATIFIALLQIDFKSNLIVIPILSIAFNLLMYVMVDKLPLRSLFNIPINRYRTLIMLIPSLAPGLSCFPFIIEYSGQGPLAMAALADVGNKVFVLIISYTIAMKWYYETNSHVSHNSNSKIKALLYSLVNEPVNLVIMAALLTLSFGFTYTDFPEAIILSIDRLSVLMTPLILLFIGLSMKLTWEQVKTIYSFLFFRSGIAFMISALVLLLFPVADLPTILLIVAFPQSACSFWPYAHMAAVTKMENKAPLGTTSTHTFDLDFAMNVLACSMPFSVILIMVIYASGSFFASSGTLLVSGASFVAVATVIVLASAKAWSLLKEDSPHLTAGTEAMEKDGASRETPISRY